ncbi:MAG: hypothetical protein R3B41_03740 [Candidatus Doudnabacteria bacterium]
MGAPEDEYDKQTNLIISFMFNNQLNDFDLENKLLEIFKTNEFDLDRLKVKVLSDRILSSLQK